MWTHKDMGIQRFRQSHIQEVLAFSSTSIVGIQARFGISKLAVRTIVQMKQANTVANQGRPDPIIQVLGERWITYYIVPAVLLVVGRRRNHGGRLRRCRKGRGVVAARAPATGTGTGSCGRRRAPRAGRGHRACRRRGGPAGARAGKSVRPRPRPAAGAAGGAAGGAWAPRACRRRGGPAGARAGQSVRPRPRPATGAAGGAAGEAGAAARRGGVGTGKEIELGLEWYRSHGPASRGPNTPTALCRALGRPALGKVYFILLFIKLCRAFSKTDTRQRIFYWMLSMTLGKIYIYFYFGPNFFCGALWQYSKL